MTGRAPGRGWSWSWSWSWTVLLQLLLLCAGALGQVTSLYEGSPCKLADGSRGQCIPLTKCPSAFALFKKDRRNFRPKRCGFQGFVEVICCADVPLRKAEEACRDFTNEINPSINVYIYGGSVAQPGEFPHMVGRQPAAWDFAEPFDDGLREGPLFRELVHRGPPLARVPPPGAPPPLALTLGADQDDAAGAPASTAAPTAADGLAGRAALLDGAGSDEASEGVELGGRTGFILGGIRDAVKRHRDRVDRVKDRVRNLGQQLFGGLRPDHQGHDARPHQDQPDEPSRTVDQPNRPDSSPPGQDDNPHDHDGRDPHRPDDRPRPVAPRPPTSTDSPARGVPDDDAYGQLIDPRAGPGASARGKSTFGSEFGALEEETTSRPRLIRVTGGGAPGGPGEGKAGRPGNWRVPPDSIWARPPAAAGAAPAPAPGAISAAPADAPPGAGFAAAEEGKAGGIALYVIGGDEAMPDEFKHMVALGFRDSSGVMTWDCGGTLISNDHVLTAAHCVTNSLRGLPARVRVGAHNLTEVDGEEHDVVQVSVHPDYSTQSHYNDVAVLRIGRVRFSDRVQPACLYTKPRAPDSGMVATGWGVTDIDQLDQTSDVLMKATMDQVPLSRCNTSFTRSKSRRLARGLQPEQLCARGANGIADTCLGDSGGPLQTLDRPLGLYSIVGITSFGQLCGGLGVYIRVSAYIDWIESVVWPDPS